MANRKQNSRARICTLAVAGAATLLAFPGVASAAVTSTVAGGVLTVSSDGADPITISCNSGKVRVNGDDLTADCNAIGSIVVNGGPGANTINLAGVTAAAFTTLTSTTIDAGDLNDSITGSERDDTIIWNPGDDDDTNDGGAGTDTIQVNGGGGAEQFTAKPSVTPGFQVRFDRTAPAANPAPFNIEIVNAERLDMNTGGGDDGFTADGGLDALGFKLDVSGGDGNDVLVGDDGADTIAGDAGNDTITADDNPVGTRDVALGGDGDDKMIWNGGDDDDINEGGAGNDVSEVNGAPADEIFTIKPSPTAGRVLFDRLATPGPGPFSIDIGTTETLHLLANAGNDRIKGSKGVDGRIRTILDAGDGNDRIRGTDAIDAISAGTGHDIVNSIDTAEDTVSCDAGFDFAFVDRRDFLRQCELVFGGIPRVAFKGAPQLDGNSVAVRLECVATAKCKSVVTLKRGGKSLGKGKATLKRGASKDVEVALNRRGRRVLSDGDRVKVQVVSKDKRGNGWRSAKTVRLG